MSLEYKTLEVDTLCSKSLGYQQVTTADECEFAAKTLGTSGITQKLLDPELYPSGCYLDLDEEIVYFNSQDNGMADPSSTPICRRQGISKLIQNINHFYDR